MKDYILIKKRTLAWFVAAIVTAIAAATAYHIVTRYYGNRQHRILIRSYNILTANGKELIYFRSIGTDSVFNGITTVSDSVIFGQKPHHSSIDLHKIVAINKRNLLKRREELDSIADEIRYYCDVHNVQDEGYDMVVEHRNVVNKAIARTSAVINALEWITPETKLEVRHIAIYKDRRNAGIPKVFMGNSNGIWTNGVWLKISANGNGVMINKCSQLISGTWHNDTLAYGRTTDQHGTYNGQFSRGLYAEGHGSYTSNDGNFYEGHWQNNMRHGFGFAVCPGSIKAGEWADDKYKGERMNYTSERVYGIDISRYQHGKGRKYYPIYWNKLRITHLGNLSKKQISGTVSYPVSFVYIKSTEGISIRNRFYASDYRQARKHGIACGAYHFFSTKTDASAQARYFLKHTYINKGDLPPVLDVEPTHAQIAKMGGEKALHRAIRTWMSIVKQHTGQNPILYISQNFVNKYLGNAPDIKRDYNIWIARYGEYRPDVRLVYWQLSPDGRVEGIHGDVDINVFNGYRDRFDMFLETERKK